MKKINGLILSLFVLSGCGGNVTSSSSSNMSNSSSITSSEVLSNSTTISNSSTIISSSSSSESSTIISSSSSSESSTIISSSSSSESSTVISSSSSSSSSSVEEEYPTIADAVNSIVYDYTVSYVDLSTGEEYSVYLEDNDTNTEAYYFRKKTNSGYYIMENGDVYFFYKNGFNKEIYNTNSKLDSDFANKIKHTLDINTVFSEALWEFMYFDNSYVYYTEDEEVINSCCFLSDGLGEGEISYVEVSLTNRGKLKGFITYDENNEPIVDATIKRINTTYAVDKAPVLDDNLEQMLVRKWMINEENETTLGTMGDCFEVFNDGSLITYQTEENGDISSKDIYNYVSPSGTGEYCFQNASGNSVLISYNKGDLKFTTYDVVTTDTVQSSAINYNEAVFVAAANKAGYVVEVMAEDDDLYNACVRDINAFRAYYVSELNASGEVFDLIVVTQFLNNNQLIDLLLGGSNTLYNGCSFGGYLYANFIVTAAATNESINIMYNITSYLTPEYMDVDESLYLDVEDNISALDYVIKAMTKLGYSYFTSENPGVFANDIATIKELNESCTEVYMFCLSDGQYAPLLVFDDLVVSWGTNGVSNITPYAYGYFEVIGELYGVLTTWGNAQVAI